jgi:signal transduction histidine kinase
MEIIEHTGHAESAEATYAPSPPNAIESWLTRPAAAWVILAISLSLTAVAWWLSRTFSHDEAQQRFERRTDDVHRRLEQRLATYEGALRGGVALFAAQGSEVSRSQWQRYVSTLHLADRYPGIQGLGVTKLIAPAQLAAHEQALRQEGFKDYAVKPAGVRDQYSSIVYLEPFEGRNLRAFGFDMMSEATRRAAMQRAGETGQAALSGTVTLVQEDGKDVQRGFLLYVPVYRGGSVPTTTEARWAALWGWVYAPFRIEDLMHGVLGAEAEQMRLTLHDGDRVTDDSKFYGSSPSASAEAAPLSLQRPLTIAGHTWTVHYEAKTTDSGFAATQSNVVAILGLFIDALLFWTIGTIARRKQQVERSALAQSTQARERTAWLDAVSDLSPNGVLVFERHDDNTFRLVFTNPAFSELFGLRPGDLTGLSEEAVDEWLDGLRGELAPNPPLTPGDAVVQLAGPPLCILHRSSREGELHRVYYFRDVTSETEVERLKDEFLTTAAHELRTPLASVYGFSELLLRPDVPEGKREKLNQIVYRQAGVLKHLVDELLDLARLDSRGEQDFVTQEVDLRKVAETAAESSGTPENPHRIQVIGGDKPLMAKVDPAKLQQAIVNATSNAIKYSAPDAPIVLRTVLTAHEGRPFAAISVEDKGIGMSPEACERAFERFFRADPSGHILGAGLGLAILKEVITLHGGHITLTSELGVGTTITLWVPLQPPAAEEAVAKPAQARTPELLTS